MSTTTTTKALHKKRAAPSQSGPPPKKKKADDLARKPSSKASANVTKPAHSKPSHPLRALKEEWPAQKTTRSRPVTAQLEEERSDSDEEIAHLDNEDDDLAAKGDELIEQDAMDTKEQAAAGSSRPKDPNAARESHKVQRAVLAERKAAKPHGALISDAKRVWALAIQKNVDRAERAKHVAALMDIVRGKVQDVVLKHDASRIIQTIVKYGGQKERDEVAVELKGKYKSLTQNRYSKFLVSKLIRYSPVHRSAILAEFHKTVVRLLLHREACTVIADAFELWGNAADRALLVRDFYGKEVLLFPGAADAAVQGLKGVLIGADDDKRRRILAALKENLDLIFNNSEKGAVSHAIVHRALWEYLSELNGLSSQEERDKLRHEAFESCQELLAEMVHTKDGSRAVREFLAQGSAKDRKQVLKCLRPHIARIAADDEAQFVLFTACDVVDDTKLLSKSIIAELPVAKLAAVGTGRRALLYLLAPRQPRYLVPALARQLAESDAARARTSKKDTAARASEVRAAASPALLAFVAEQGAEAMRDPASAVLVLEIMLSADGDKSAATQALLVPLAAPYPPPEGTEHALDLGHTTRLVKALLQGGHFDRATGAVARAPEWAPGPFASKLLQTLSQDAARALALSGGAFVLVELCERIRLEGTPMERATLRKWFNAQIMQKLKEAAPRGGGPLIAKINALEA